MSELIEGKIISTNLAEFAAQKIIYGYIGIELPDKKHIKVKIDSYTWYETLTIGDEIILEADKLPNTDIIVARKIQMKTNVKTTSEELKATT